MHHIYIYIYIYIHVYIYVCLLIGGPTLFPDTPSKPPNTWPYHTKATRKPSSTILVIPIRNNNTSKRELIHYVFCMYRYPHHGSRLNKFATGAFLSFCRTTPLSKNVFVRNNQYKQAAPPYTLAPPYSLGIVPGARWRQSMAPSRPKRCFVLLENIVFSAKENVVLKRC